MIVVWGWLIAIASLFFYSFTQIDLGLTLTRASFWQPIQKAFQFIGYFKRPLSATIYVVILLLLFLFYFLLLNQVKKGRLTQKQIWRLILATAAILWLAYNAFSYDLFNYIFDARIVTFYRQNPYQRRALDFPGDPMLGFMHWTHRLYPYGPVWLALSVPLSFLAGQKLIPIMILFKSLGVIGYLVSAWSIDKILKQLKPAKAKLGLVFFAFNPLIIVESLVAAHNDILMMAFVLVAFWLLLEKKHLWAWTMFFLSVGIKFATGLLVPVFLYVTLWHWRKRKISWEKVWLTTIFLMAGAVLAAGWRIGEIKPWYWLFVFPFVPFLIEKKWLLWLTFGLTIGFLLYYAPFFYLGNWNPPVPMLKNIFALGPLGAAMILFLLEKKRFFLPHRAK